MPLDKIKSEIKSFLTSNKSSASANSDGNFQKHPQNFGASKTEHLDASTNIQNRKFSVKEKSPGIENYRNEGAEINPSVTCSRPSMADLHLAVTSNTIRFENVDVNVKKPYPTIQSKTTKNAKTKFGWVQGVLLRCILNILGAILYLRLGWVAGNAGIVLGCVIVLLGALVTFLTALSMSAICTNGEIKGGGVYFMISRSLGPEFGGSIGIIFTIANNVGGAMYITGFAETVRDLMKEHGAAIIDNGENDVRIIGWATAVVLLAIITLGVSFEAKAQFFLLIILGVSLVNFVAGTFMTQNDAKRAQGFTGYSTQTAWDNLWPSWSKEIGFFDVFAVYFPAATGIMAGANVSGDLKNPQTSIPKGTLLAIAITTIIYLGGVVLPASTCLKNASGIVEQVLNGTITDCATNGSKCEYGLLNYQQVMTMISAWRPLITAGIFAATLSSALASLVSAPKILQALGNDKLYPFLHFFAKGYGKANEPRRGYILAFIICMAIIGIGNLDDIAAIISNFFLASYALVNYSCFYASFSESVGFRPSFKYYNKWVSLFGAFVCLAVMFVIQWRMALVTLACIVMLYFFIYKTKPDVNWGASNQAYWYKSALTRLYQLLYTEEHVKNYRPQVLLLTGTPMQRPSLVDFVANVTKKSSLLILGDVFTVETTHLTLHNMKLLSKYTIGWLKKRKLKAFYQPVTANTLQEGVKCLLQTAGIGKLVPNIVLIGYKTNWQKCDVKQLSDYFQALQ